MPEASYDEASRARYRARASRPGGSGPGGFDNGTRAIFLVLMIVFAVVVGRLMWLQVIDASNLSEEAEQHRTNVITLHAKRGTIYDRNGNVLAMSVDCKTIYCNPKGVPDPSGVARILVANLGGSASDYTGALTTDSTFAYVQRQVDTDVADTIKQQLSDAKLKGVYYLDDTKRVYPYGDVASQVLGVSGLRWRRPDRP